MLNWWLPGCKASTITHVLTAMWAHVPHLRNEDITCCAKVFEKCNSDSLDKCCYTNHRLKWFVYRSKAVFILWIIHVIYVVCCSCYCARLFLMPCGNLLGNG